MIDKSIVITCKLYCCYIDAHCEIFFSPIVWEWTQAIEIHTSAQNY